MSKAYRFIDKFQWTDEIEWEERIELVEYDIIRETPKGFYIKHYGKEKWVGNVVSSNEKRFAYRDKSNALNGFMEKKYSELSHLKRRTRQIQRIIDYNKDGRKNDAILRMDGAIVHKETVKYSY